MAARIIFLAYVLFSVLEFFWEQFLSALNVRHVRANAHEVPPEFRDAVPEDLYRTSVLYTLAKSRFSLVVSTVTTAAVLALTAGGWLGRLEAWTAGWNFHPYVRGILYFLLVALGFKLLSVPFSLYSHFVLEQRFGFNKMTLKTFFSDQLKSSVLSAVLLVPVLVAVFLFMDVTGDAWWLYAFLLVIVLQVLLMILYPVAIAPLFNKFKPIEKGPLEEKITALAERLAFGIKGVFVMDGSRRSGHSNAFFTGLGRAKRIVLYDTLVNELPEDQVVSVLAHEIGHEKKRHVLKNMIMSMILTGLLFALLGLLRGFRPLYEAFGFSGPSPVALLAILSFVSSPFTFFLTPLFSALSRKYEFEADRYAVEATGNPDHLSGALLSLGKDNLSNLTPHPLYSFFYYSHPPLSERIGAIRRVKPRT